MFYHKLMLELFHYLAVFQLFMHVVLYSNHHFIFSFLIIFLLKKIDV